MHLLRRRLLTAERRGGERATGFLESSADLKSARRHQCLGKMGDQPSSPSTTPCLPVASPGPWEGATPLVKGAQQLGASRNEPLTDLRAAWEEDSGLRQDFKGRRAGWGGILAFGGRTASWARRRECEVDVLPRSWRGLPGAAGVSWDVDGADDDGLQPGALNGIRRSKNSSLLRCGAVLAASHRTRPVTMARRTRSGGLERGCSGLRRRI